MSQTPPAQTPDEALLGDVAQGGSKGTRALETLFKRHHRDMLALARRRGLSIEDAHDVVQTVFLNLVDSASGFRSEGSVVGWLMVSTRNKAMDRHRQSAKEVMPDEDAWAALESSLVDPGECPYDALRMKSMRDCVNSAYKAFAKAHPFPSEVLYQSVHLDLKDKDLALLLGRTDTATRTLLSDCRKKVRAFMAPCLELLRGEVV